MKYARGLLYDSPYVGCTLAQSPVVGCVLLQSETLSTQRPVNVCDIPLCSNQGNIFLDGDDTTSVNRQIPFVYNKSLHVLNSYQNHSQVKPL